MRNRRLHYLLTHNHNLTRRQADMAIAFMKTADTATAAAQIGIQAGSGRQNMKAIYNRTGTRNTVTLMKHLIEISRTQEHAD